MSSNNIDENAMLRYISFCFQIWGIDYVNKDIFKKARENLPQQSYHLTCLIFHLSILEISDFQYRIDNLGIKLQQKQFTQEFVISYLSQANCPFLFKQNGKEQYHILDFKQSRILLLIVGWLMAKFDFFNKIKTKLIPKLYSNLYIQRNVGKNKPNKITQYINLKSNLHSLTETESKVQLVQRLYRDLNQHQFRLQSLQRKKQKIYLKLQKQVQIYNKTNATNIKIENILQDGNISEEQISKQEQILQQLISQCVKGLKNQQYFWMWLQYKVIQPQFKYLQSQYEEQFERVEPPEIKQWTRLNPDYLSRYDQQFKSISKKIQEINQYMLSNQQLINVKNPKDSVSIRKQVFYDAKQIIVDQNNQILYQLGIPCFLKLEVSKYFKTKGFGAKSKKNKKKNVDKLRTKGSQNQEQLKRRIKQFVQNLDQIKFI